MEEAIQLKGFVRIWMYFSLGEKDAKDGQKILVG